MLDHEIRHALMGATVEGVVHVIKQRDGMDILSLEICTRRLQRFTVEIRNGEGQLHLDVVDQRLFYTDASAAQDRLDTA
jgi:hypothetical protein